MFRSLLLLSAVSVACGNDLWGQIDQLVLDFDDVELLFDVDEANINVTEASAAVLTMLETAKEAELSANDADAFQLVAQTATGEHIFGRMLSFLLIFLEELHLELEKLSAQLDAGELGAAKTKVQLRISSLVTQTVRFGGKIKPLVA